MATCKDCVHWRACKAMLEATGYSVSGDFAGSAERCDTFVPTADLVEVRHGEWMPTDPESDVRFFCSECETEISTSWDYQDPEMWRYCPRCGAKMDGERKEQG